MFPAAWASVEVKVRHWVADGTRRAWNSERSTSSTAVQSCWHGLADPRYLPPDPVMPSRLVCTRVDNGGSMREDRGRGDPGLALGYVLLTGAVAAGVGRLIAAAPMVLSPSGASAGLRGAPLSRSALVLRGVGVSAVSRKTLLSPSGLHRLRHTALNRLPRTSRLLAMGEYGLLGAETDHPYHADGVTCQRLRPRSTRGQPQCIRGHGCG